MVGLSHHRSPVEVWGQISGGSEKLRAWKSLVHHFVYIYIDWFIVMVYTHGLYDHGIWSWFIVMVYMIMVYGDGLSSWFIVMVFWLYETTIFWIVMVYHPSKFGTSFQWWLGWLLKMMLWNCGISCCFLKTIPGDFQVSSQMQCGYPLVGTHPEN